MAATTICTAAATATPPPIPARARDYSYTYTTGPDGRVIGFTAVTDNVGGDEGSDTLTSIEALAFNGQTLDLAQPVQLFDAGNVLVGTFDTIQAAIDAASDDYTIRVAAGTYDEDLVIDVGVTILGAQEDVAVGGRDAAGGTGETDIIGHAQVTATDNVTLNGLRFLNDSTTTGGGPAISTFHDRRRRHRPPRHRLDLLVDRRRRRQRLDDRAIFDAGHRRRPDHDHRQPHLGRVAAAMFGTASWGRGIWFDGGGVDLVATGNTIEWTRSGLNLDMSGDSTANVSNNDLRNLGTGIAVGVDADGLTVVGNDIMNVGNRVQLPQPDHRRHLRRRNGDRHSDSGRQRQRSRPHPRRLGQRHSDRHRRRRLYRRQQPSRPTATPATMTC